MRITERKLKQLMNQAREDGLRDGWKLPYMVWRNKEIDKIKRQSLNDILLNRK